MSRLLAMTHQYAETREYHEVITKAAKFPGQSMMIRWTHEAALLKSLGNATKYVSQLLAPTALSLWYGLWLYHDCGKKEDHEEAMSTLEKSITLSSLAYDARLNIISSNTIARLAAFLPPRS